jgi:hypothetical protein
MRRPTMAVAVAALILAAATLGGFALASCGGSSGGSTTEAAASGLPGGGQMPDASAMFTQALDPLVEAGTITSEQEAAVVAALASSMPAGGGMGQGGRPPSPGAQPSAGATPPSGSIPDPGQMFSSALDGLVAAGTITAEQESAISAALSSAIPQGGPGQAGGTQSQSY